MQSGVKEQFVDKDKDYFWMGSKNGIKDIKNVIKEEVIICTVKYNLYLTYVLFKTTFNRGFISLALHVNAPFPYLTQLSMLRFSYIKIDMYTKIEIKK